MCLYINKKSTDLSGIFVISFVDVLVNFDNKSKISNVSHKTKLPRCCVIVAPNQPKNEDLVPNICDIFINISHI